MSNDEVTSVVMAPNKQTIKKKKKNRLLYRTSEKYLNSGSEDSDKKGEGDTVLKRQIDRNLSSDRRTQPPHLITILREG